jgi:hypothetical protein
MSDIGARELIEELEKRNHFRDIIAQIRRYSGGSWFDIVSPPGTIEQDDCFPAG